MSVEMLLAAIREKDQQIAELSAQVSKLVSDAGWVAESSRRYELEHRGDTWK